MARIFHMAGERKAAAAGRQGSCSMQSNVPVPKRRAGPTAPQGRHAVATPVRARQGVIHEKNKNPKTEALKEGHQGNRAGHKTPNDCRPSRAPCLFA